MFTLSISIGYGAESAPSKLRETRLAVCHWSGYGRRIVAGWEPSSGTLIGPSGLIEHPLPPVESLTERVPHVWRGQILRQMIWAHLVLELEGRADVAITVFFDTYRRVKAERRRVHGSALSSISLWPAEVEIAKTLLTGYYPNTDPKLYEQFIRHFASQHKTTPYSIAQLALQHPQKPDPSPAFACIMERLLGLTAMEYQQLFPPKTSTGKSMYFVARRAEDLLREQGKVEEAEQIETLLKRLVSNEERHFLDDAFSRDKELKRELKNSWARRSDDPDWTRPKNTTDLTTLTPKTRS
ncbi:hypothetical protein LTR97_009588 [Elasticomyces elasticus]|uniref:Uncharacterized protein n=1 Tax=Elasticomyces elasticus TaxID=574655 RepID=A0AAN7W0V2_9PEZI|nr:hypothetical protein LTR97_009588 [Elasticomyces elasticus]